MQCNLRSKYLCWIISLSMVSLFLTMGGQFRRKFHHPLVSGGVFCQSAIENAQKDQAAVVQNILDNKVA